MLEREPHPAAVDSLECELVAMRDRVRGDAPILKRMTAGVLRPFFPRIIARLLKEAEKQNALADDPPDPSQRPATS